jgi:serine/threonine protein kinase
MDELAPGTVISDRFEIEKLVGHGGMGTVYRALDRAQGQRTEGTAASTVVNWTTVLPPSFNLLLLNGLVDHVGDGLLLATAP